MIVGKSLLHKRVYVDREDPEDKKVRALSERGYEVVELGGRPVALALKSDVGLCSGPTVYSARHCFGDPSEDVKGRRYVLVNTDIEGRVTKDYSPFLMNVAKMVLYLFGKPYGVYDVVRVSTPAYDANGQVALVTGGVVGQPVGLLSHTPNVDPEDVVGKDLNIVVDVPENDEIKAHVHDYAVMLIWYRSMVWPTEVLVAHTSKPLKPGNSGGPAYLKQ
jgi:hypothetical protein